MKKQNHSFVFLVIILLLGAAIWISLSTRQTTNYTRDEFEDAVESGQVVSITIVQNKEVPTGTIQATMKNNSIRQFNATDVHEIEAYARENSIPVKVSDVPADNWFLMYPPGRRAW